MVGPSIKGKWIYILYVVEKKWNNFFTTRFTAVVHLCSTSTSVNISPSLWIFSIWVDFMQKKVCQKQLENHTFAKFQPRL